MKHPARPLPWEDQLGKALAVHQALGAIFFGADKFGAGAAGLGLGVTGHVQPRGVFGNLGTDFTFKARAAVHKKGVHSTLLGNGNSTGIALSQSLSRKRAHDSRVRNLGLNDRVQLLAC